MDVHQVTTDLLYKILLRENTDEDLEGAGRMHRYREEGFHKK
jgi:hypothetical protein